MFSTRKNKDLGFTLIELLVVISVIGVVASLVLASLNSAREKAQYAAARAEMKEIEKLVVMAQINTGQYLGQITGSYWSRGACNGLTEIYDLPITHNCHARWRTTIDNIILASGTDTEPSGFYTDPWGSPYLLDENEGEGGNPANCGYDSLRAGGPLGLGGGTIGINLPHAKC